MNRQVKHSTSRILTFCLTALAGVFLGSTAQAADPAVVWSSDFDITQKIGSGNVVYSLDLGSGNTVNADGTVKMGGSGYITVNGIPNADYITVVVGLKNVPATACTLIGLNGTGVGMAASYMTMNASGKFQAGWCNGSSYNDNWSDGSWASPTATLTTGSDTVQYISMAYHGTKTTTNDRGTAFFKDGAKVYPITGASLVSGLVADAVVKSVTIGGNNGRTNSTNNNYLGSGAVVTYLAIYTSTITDTTEIETAQSLSATTYPLYYGTTAYYNFDYIFNRDTSSANGTLNGYKWDTDSASLVADPSLDIAYTKDSGAMAVDDDLKKFYGYFSGGGKNARIYQGTGTSLAPLNHGDWSFSMWFGRKSATSAQLLLVNGVPLTSNIRTSDSASFTGSTSENIGFGLYALQNNDAPYWIKPALRFSTTSDGTTFTSHTIISDSAICTFSSSNYKEDGKLWHNVAVVRSGTSVVMYVNGTSRGSTTIGANDYIVLPNSGSGALYTRPSNTSMDGKDRIDDVCVWNRALKSTEITTIAAGSVYHTDAIDYTGTLNATAATFAVTAQTGITSSGDWSNGPNNTITLNNTQVDAATVEFSGEVTARSLTLTGTGSTTVSAAPESTVTFDSVVVKSSGDTTVDLANATVGAYNFSAATGKTTLTGSWGTAPLKVGSDTVINSGYLGSGTITLGSGKKITYSGTTTLTTIPFNDALYYNANDCGTVALACPIVNVSTKLEVKTWKNYVFEEGFSLTADKLILGNKNANGDASPIQNYTQNGGSLTLSASYTSTDESTTAMPLLMAHWPSTVNYTMNGGTISCPNGYFLFGRDGNLYMTVGDGTGSKTASVSVYGIHSNGRSNDSSLTLKTGGTVTLAAGGLDFNSEKKVVFAGGTLATSANARVNPGSANTSNSGTTSSLAPASGTTMTVSAALKGAGNFSVDGPGTVVLSVTPTTTGSFSIGASGILQLSSGVSLSRSLSWTSGAKLVVPEGTTGQICTTSMSDASGLTVYFGSTSGTQANAAVYDSKLILLPAGTTFNGTTLTVAADATLDTADALYTALLTLYPSATVTVNEGGTVNLAGTLSGVLAGSGAVNVQASTTLTTSGFTGTATLSDSVALTLGSGSTPEFSLAWGTGCSLVVAEGVSGRVCKTESADLTNLTVYFGSTSGTAANAIVYGGYILLLPAGTTFDGSTLTVPNGVTVDVTGALFTALRTLYPSCAVSVADGGSLALTEAVGDEGSATITGVTWLGEKSVTVTHINGNTADDVAVTTDGTTTTVKYAPQVDAGAAWIAYEFNGNLSNTGTEGTALSDDNDDGVRPYQVAFGSDFTNENTVVYAGSHPWRNMGSGYPENWTCAIAGTLPELDDAALITFGSTTTGSNYGFIGLITGEVEKETVYLVSSSGYVDNNTHYVTNAVMTVPNATSTRHLYVFIKEGNTLIVYLDGKRWSQWTSSSTLAFGNGMQVASVHGGIGNSGVGRFRPALFTDNVNDPRATKATIDSVRLYNRVLTQASIDALKNEFPYSSPNGTYTRTFGDGAATWSSDAMWEKSGTEETSALPAYNGLVNVTLAGASEITVSFDSEATQPHYEQFNVSGAGTTTFALDDASDKQIVVAEFYTSCDVTNKYNATKGMFPVDLTLGVTSIATDGSVTFDLTDYPFSKIMSQTDIPLTGTSSSDVDSQVSVILPANTCGRTVTKTFDTGTSQWVARVTVDRTETMELYIKGASYSVGDAAYSDADLTTAVYPIAGDTFIIDKMTQGADLTFGSATNPLKYSGEYNAYAFNSITGGGALTMASSKVLSVGTINRDVTLAAGTLYATASGLGNVTFGASNTALYLSGTTEGVNYAGQVAKSDSTLTGTSVTIYKGKITCTANQFSLKGDTLTVSNGATLVSNRDGITFDSFVLNGTWQVASYAKLNDLTINEGAAISITGGVGSNWPAIRFRGDVTVNTDLTITVADATADAQRVQVDTETTFTVAEGKTFTIDAKVINGYDNDWVTGVLTKKGAGKMVLTADASYSGATTVSAGTLVVNGASTLSAFTVANGATLGGTGSVGGGVTFVDGANFVVTGATALTGNSVTSDGAVSVSLGTGVTASSRKILGWSAAPAGMFTLSDSSLTPKWTLVKTAEGLYLRKRPVMVIVK